MSSKIRRYLTAPAVLLFWLVVWEVLSAAIGEEILLPGPILVASTLWRLCRQADFWLAVAMSLLRVLAGFGAAVLAGGLLAVLTSRVELMRRLFAPVLHIVRAAPVASFIILAFFWIRVAWLPAFIAFLTVVPLVWANVSEGIAQTDRRLLEMARVYRLGRRKTWRYVWLPSVKPYFLAACTTGLGFAWKSAIAAEVICNPQRGIGSGLRDAKAYLEMPAVFAWTVMVVLVSVCMEWALKHLLKTHKGVRAG